MPHSQKTRAILAQLPEPPSGPLGWRKRFTRTFGGGKFLMLISGLVLLLVGLLAYFLYADYQRTLEEERNRLDYVGGMLAEQIEGSMDRATIQMQPLIKDIAQRPLFGHEWVESQYGAQLRGALAEINQIDSLVLIDPWGKVLWSSAAQLVGVSLADRGYFQKAIRLSPGDRAIGVPITSRGTGRRVTPIAWPIRDDSGELHGVFASSLGEDHFETLLDETSFVPEMKVEVIMASGEVGFSTPNVTGNEELSEENYLVSVTPANRDEFSVAVALPMSLVLEPFRNRTFRIIGLVGALFAIAIASAVVAQRRALQLAQSLRRSERDRGVALRAMSEFETIFQTVDDGIVVFDEGREFEKANRKARELLRVEDASAASAQVLAAMPELDAKMDGPEVFIVEVEDPDHPDNEPLRLRCRVTRLGNKSDYSYYCVLNDITAQERLAEARDHFVASVNHEMRTPLASLTGSLEILSSRYSEALPPAAGKLISMSLRNAERLLHLINDILTVQAIDHGHLAVELKPLRASTVLQDAVEQNEGYGLPLNVRLTQAPMQGDALLEADPMRLQQALANLISNAMKYSPRDGEVVVGADTSEGKVTFWVRDQGPGIPKSAKRRIFHRFARPVHSPGVQKSGTGLGLAITKELVERQNGEVALESRAAEEGAEGRSGTTFFLSFPAHAIPARRMMA